MITVFSESWDVAAGVGQGAVLSGFLFDLLINGLAAAIKRACVGVACNPEPDASRVQVLLYAEDVVILCETAEELQLALDAAAAWANAWRFNFSDGPNKSAVMTFGHGRAAVPPFHVGEHALPHVRSSTHLGTILHERLSFSGHVDELLRRGEGKIAACLFWTASTNLPLTFVERVFQCYVRPSVCFGLEFVASASLFRKFQTRFNRLGRRLLFWPQDSPAVAVHGQLGWQDVDTLRLTQAASLWARLLTLPSSCCASRIVYYAGLQEHSLAHSIQAQRCSELGVAHPSS